MNYFGPKETEVISRLSYEKVTVITKEQFEELFKRSGSNNKIISQLKKKGVFKSISRGIYYFSPLESGPVGTQINEFLIPPLLFPKENYYIGYSNMYNFYGFTTQIFQTIFVLNTSLQRERIICGVPFKLLKISPKRMYGLNKIKIKNTEIIVSDRERTIVDLFYFPDSVGGIKKAFGILEKQISENKLDVKKMIDYIRQFPNVSVKKRMGYFLEKCNVSEKLLKSLKDGINNSSLTTLYGSKSRKGEINKEWKVIIDASS